MKLLRIILVLVLGNILSSAQTPGTVTTATVTTITALAGNITCTFTSGSVIQSACNGNGASMTAGFPIPVPSPGTVGNFSVSGNTVTWSLKASVTTGKTDWNVAANGTSASGTF